MTEESRTSAPPTFASLGISEDVLRAIDEMGWEVPTAVQRDSYAQIVSGQDLIVQARTGTGKTGAFGIPLVDRRVEPKPSVQALILAPTRELALQSAREIRKLGTHRGITIAAVYGGASMDKQIREIKQGAQIISGTPGRVLDHLGRGTLSLDDISVLVLDEADEMLSMGFAKELNAIIEYLPKERQTLLFSATVDSPVQRIAERHMNDPEFLSLSGDHVGALGIDHFVYMVSGVGRVRDLIAVLEAEDPESAIIFCNTKAETESVATALQQAGFNAAWLTGDRSQRDRERVLDDTRKGKARFLVATDVAARGIDVSHLTHVINFTLPGEVEQYVHRTGRTGRAGRTGTALALVGPAELGTLYYLRLMFRISPVERSLPTQGDERTRREADRVSMLEQAFIKSPSEIDLAVARRLMTHPHAERLLAGLLDAFFGAEEEDVDEIAAAARRAGESERPPVPAAEPPTPEEVAPPRTQQRPKSTTLYVNVGRRDEIRAAQLGRFLRDKTGLSRREIGRIRIRDGHSLVDVPVDRADEIIAALSGEVLQERELSVELAKSP